MSRLQLLPSFEARSRILICEGESDYELLDGVISSLTDRIFVVAAGGEENLKKYRQFLGQQERTIYIRDRDFTMSLEAAQATLTDSVAKTVWPCFDMEGYLLYADWILEALNSLQQSPKLKSQKLTIPPDHNAVEQMVKQVAQALVIEYAGRQTLYQIRGTLGFIRKAHRMPDLSNNTAANFSLEEWKNSMQALTEQLGIAMSQIPLTESLWNKNIQQRLQQNYDHFMRCTQTAADCRIYFSGKAIFKGLAQAWGSHYSGDTLRDEVITTATNYAKQHASSGLRTDPRLGDMALLAEKLLADGTKL